MLAESVPFPAIWDPDHRLWAPALWVVSELTHKAGLHRHGRSACRNSVTWRNSQGGAHRVMRLEISPDVKLAEI